MGNFVIALTPTQMEHQSLPKLTTTSLLLLSSALCIPTPYHTHTHTLSSSRMPLIIDQCGHQGGRGEQRGLFVSILHPDL